MGIIGAPIIAARDVLEFLQIGNDIDKTLIT